MRFRMERMLHITTGCMYSGKTSHLIRTASKGGLVIDYDTTMESGTLTSHTGESIPCITTRNLSTIYDTEATSIFINEAQFFDELVPFVQKMMARGKTVHVYGLDGDFKQESFGHILDLIPMADTYTKLYAVCEGCQGKASFSKRLSSNTIQYCPQASYIPVCRACL